MARLPFFIAAYVLLSLFQAASVAAQQAPVRALEEQLKGTNGLPRVELLIALSDAYLSNVQVDEALERAEEAERLSQQLGLTEWRAVALNRQGRARWQGGKRRPAAPFEQSLKILKQAHIHNAALAKDNLGHLQQIARQAGREREAAQWAAEWAQWNRGNAADPFSQKNPSPQPPSVLSLQEVAAVREQLAAQAQRFEQDRKRLLDSSRHLQQKLAQQEAALAHLTAEQMRASMIVMQQRLLLDSVLYRRGLDSLAVVNAYLALREAESSRRFQYAVIGALLILSIGFFLSYRRIRREKRRSENLLLNILPQRVAEELKRMGRTEARFYPNATVLFADFVGFSRIAEKLSPQQLVSDIDICFQKFDEIVTRYGLEKIKTIGDAYMCAGGLSEEGDGQVREVLQAAIDMQRWLASWNAGREQQGLPRFDARIGIHCGPVVAGVVGSRKFAFDIWGDTVNVAARVEQAGMGGRINLSGAVYQAIRGHFPCEYRGKVEAKNKGEIDMYFLAN